MCFVLNKVNPKYVLTAYDKNRVYAWLSKWCPVSGSPIEAPQFSKCCTDLILVYLIAEDRLKSCDTKLRLGYALVADKLYDQTDASRRTFHTVT